MQSRFIDFIHKKNLLSEKDNILLGVSGGIDSMVMLHLFVKSGFKITVAHCNFSLRGDESDGDEQLVIHYCELNGIKLHRVRFETEKYAQENKLSIQVAARNLRYEWFNGICNDFGYTKLAIAHNRDDVAETMLINLSRGTGLKGLTGIKPKQGSVVRPLLFAGRDEITRFAVQNDIKYREDSSNSSVKYARNRIRHNVLPELEKLNPSVKVSIVQTADHLLNVWELVSSYVATLRLQFVKEEADTVCYSIDGLVQEPHAKLFLFEELSPYGFTSDTIERIYQSVKGKVGKVFYSSTHQLLRDRNYLLLTQRKESGKFEIEIQSDCEAINYPIGLHLKLVDKCDLHSIPNEPDFASLDYDKLIFPLKLRQWQPGDKFMPFGMNKFKKVSDFLIDQKISLFEKEEIYVLESGNEIVWIVGKRIDDRFKISNQTKKIWIAKVS